MGLYLCIFDDDEELDAVEVGTYDDFGQFRDFICDQLEGGTAGARFPVLMHHSDCDGQWTSAECGELLGELMQIASELAKLPPRPFQAKWQIEEARKVGLIPASALESFIDIECEPLVPKLIGLAKLSISRSLPIRFQ